MGQEAQILLFMALLTSTHTHNTNTDKSKLGQPSYHHQYATSAMFLHGPCILLRVITEAGWKSKTPKYIFVLSPSLLLVRLPRHKQPFDENVVYCQQPEWDRYNYWAMFSHYNNVFPWLWKKQDGIHLEEKQSFTNAPFLWQLPRGSSHFSGTIKHKSLAGNPCTMSLCAHEEQGVCVLLSSWASEILHSPHKDSKTRTIIPCGDKGYFRLRN